MTAFQEVFKWPPSCPDVIPKMSSSIHQVVITQSPSGQQLVTKWPPWSLDVLGPLRVPMWSQVVVMWYSRGQNVIKKWSASDPLVVPKLGHIVAKWCPVLPMW